MVPLLLTALLGLAQTPPANRSAPTDGSWTLTRLTDANGTVAAPPGLTLTVATDRVSGQDGCNTFGGAAAFTFTTVRVSNLVSTMRACPPPVSTLAGRYLALLGRVRGVALGPDSLVLSSGEGRLVFSRPRPAADAPLFSTWRLEGGLGENPPTLRLGEDGRVSGSTGCNTFTGTFTRAGANLGFSPLATTRRACLDPALAEQERTYLRLLADVRSAALVDGALVVRLADGSQRRFVR